ncbi:MAG TPA: hypothetical protein VJV78_17930 [Polyangiales bacterium]|nr:hypothetical protein [Polyangiales bacterium]
MCCARVLAALHNGGFKLPERRYADASVTQMAQRLGGLLGRAETNRDTHV